MTNRFTNRPPSFLQMEEARVKEELDKGFSRIYDAHAQLDQQAVRGPAGLGFTAASGEVTVTGSRLRIVTGLSMVEHAVASIAGAAASNQWITVEVTPANKATIDVYVWKPTAAGDNTPIASTVSTVVKWFCTGS